MTFSHPLARSSSLFTARNNDGGEFRALAIVTTLELDPKSSHYKKPFVERLSKAAKDYLASSGEADPFVLMNRPKDWGDRSVSGRSAKPRERRREKSQERVGPTKLD